jgi:hypothetical protein
MSKKNRKVASLAPLDVSDLLVDLRKPVRLASISSNGFPLISTLWFLYEEGYFWCITQEKTILRQNLLRNPRCAFEISLDEGQFKLLRGQGMAELKLSDGRRVTELMIQRYMIDTDGAVAKGLRAQIPTEYAVCISPLWIRGQG